MACLGSPAASQPLHQHGAASAPGPDDGLGPRDTMLQADSLVDNRDDNTVIAVGHVQARQGGRTLRADKVVYNRLTGAVHATGHAVMMNADGTSEYGQDVVLDDQFRAALAYGFALREAGNITLVAGAAIRRTETINQLNDAVYTACNICAQNGAPKQPTWSIQASRIVQDRQRHVIYYRNAILRIAGVPVLYAPVFWHPDPTSPPRSGLLPPRIEVSKRRGFSYEQPYLFVINPSTDLVISPQLNTRINPLLNGEIIKRFYSGLIDIRAGYTYSEEFDNHTFFNKDSSRSYVLGRGLFEIQPNWVWGFGAERVTDPTFFARYGVHDVYADRGPYTTDTDRLISQIYTSRQDSNTYVSIAALDYQSLRASGRDANNVVIGESAKSFPVVGPSIEARYDPTEPFFGGEFSVKATAVSLQRNSAVVAFVDPNAVLGPGAASPRSGQTPLDYINGFLGFLPPANVKQLSAIAYDDARRASIEADWRRTFTLDNGIQIQPFVRGRGDLYSISNSTVYDFSSGAPAARQGKGAVARGLPTIGANLSWPFVRQFGASSLVLEPLAQIVVAPLQRLDRNIPNEDSVSFEYDTTNLFSVDRFAGYDLVESGQRLNVGGRASIDWGASHNASITVGRTFRAQDDPQFTLVSGLERKASDWVTQVTFTPIDQINFFSRGRLDANSFALRENDTGVSVGGPRLNVGLRYDYNVNGYSVAPFNIAADGTVSGGNSVIGLTQSASVFGTAFVTPHWGVSANVTRNFEATKGLPQFPTEQLGLVYQDECIRMDLLYTHDATYNGVIGSTNAITFRITLATLGGAGPNQPSRLGRR